MNRTVLVTGSAGFIGYFLSLQLLHRGYKVIGLDNLNDYYDINLKHSRLDSLLTNRNFSFERADISIKQDLLRVFTTYPIDYVVNLAAQAGVRYSLENPDAYISSNIVGFFNVLEMCKNYSVKHLVYASSSSVYGSNQKVPFEETDFVDHPVSLYAATKKSNELMADTYSHLYHIPSTGLRFFTVYGPMGRPDMAYFSFLNNYFRGESIKVYNSGDFDNDLFRDFTYIDDIVDGIMRVLDNPPTNVPMHRVLNIGNNNPIKLMDFIRTLEKCLSKTLNREVEFIKQFESIKPGDVRKTYASITALEELTGFKPTTRIEDGLQKFTNWYVAYYQVK